MKWDTYMGGLGVLVGSALQKQAHALNVAFPSGRNNRNISALRSHIHKCNIQVRIEVLIQTQERVG